MDKCPNCGAKVYPSDKRCSKCGQELKKNSNGSVIAILLFVALIAIFGVFASSHMNEDTTVGTVANYAVSSDDSVEETSADDSVEETTSSDNSQVSSSSSSDSSSGIVYWASDESDKFHKPSCEWAQKISDWTKIVYHSREEFLLMSFKVLEFFGKYLSSA